MNASFHVAASGVKGQQTHLDTVANNMANLNTVGYKTTNASFVDLMYQNMYAEGDPDLKLGSGTRVEKTDTIFTQGFFQQTGNIYDYAIEGEGFFAVRNPNTGGVEFTREGAFRKSETPNGFMLVTSAGYNVLNKAGEPINLTDIDESRIGELLGVYEFETKEGLLLQGNNTYIPTEKNGQIDLKEDAKLVNGMLEASNVELTDQMTKVIEAQRAYQFNIRMVQTSDEVMQLVNSLR